MEAHLRRQREQRERELAAKKAAEQRWHQAPASTGARFAGLRKENNGKSWTVQKKEERSASAPSARAAASASTSDPATASARAGLSPVRVAGRKTGPVNVNKPLFNGHGFASRADLHKNAERDARKAAEEALHRPRQTGGGRFSVFRARANKQPASDLRRAPNLPASATSAASFIKRVSRRLSRKLSSPFLSDPIKAQPKQQLAAVQEKQQLAAVQEFPDDKAEEERHEEEEKAAEPKTATKEPAEDKPTTAAVEEALTEAAAEAPPQEEEADEVKPEPLTAKH